jgi:hypothetical protein
VTENGTIGAPVLCRERQRDRALRHRRGPRRSIDAESGAATGLDRPDHPGSAPAGRATGRAAASCAIAKPLDERARYTLESKLSEDMSDDSAPPKVPAFRSESGCARNRSTCGASRRSFSSPIDREANRTTQSARISQVEHQPGKTDDQPFPPRCTHRERGKVESSPPPGQRRLTILVHHGLVWS